MDYNQKTLNRKNYKPHRSLRANKTLKQLVILAVKSSKQEGLHFNQIKCVLKNSLNIECSNFILKLTLQQLLSTNHLSIKNQFYKLTQKKFNRKKKVTNSRLSRKTRKRVLKQAKSCRTAMKSTVSGLLASKYKVLERVVMKAMRALKRDAVKSKTRTGFVFNQIKAQVKRVAKHKRIRNVVLIKALENLRNSGEILLKKGRNYLRKRSQNKKDKDGKNMRKGKINRKAKKARKGKNVRKSKLKAKKSKSTKSKVIKSNVPKNVTKSKATNSNGKSNPSSNNSKSAKNEPKSKTVKNHIEDILVEAKRESINELKEPTSESSA